MLYSYHSFRYPILEVECPTVSEPQYFPNHYQLQLYHTFSQPAHATGVQVSFVTAFGAELILQRPWADWMTSGKSGGFWVCVFFLRVEFHGTHLWMMCFWTWYCLKLLDFCCLLGISTQNLMFCRVSQIGNDNLEVPSLSSTSKS